jgi:hypothetical protein
MPKSAHSRSGASGFGSRLASFWDGAGPGKRVAAVLVPLVVIALIAAGAVLAVGGSPKAAAKSTTTTDGNSTTTTRGKAGVASDICPLTGTIAPHGKVPQRPALGVKIGNDPSSRPQSGLPYADIVYEEMAEGGITRYLAIFQCHTPPAIGPIRSVRWDDWHILQSYGHPILSFSGGIDEWDTAVAEQTWLYDANGSEGPSVSAYYRTTNRVPPWNYYSSGAALWGLDKNHTPPPQQYQYTSSVPSEAKPVKGATIEGFATGSNVVWRWNAKKGWWDRYYGTQPDVDVSGAQLHAANVIIQLVATQPGPYAESCIGNQCDNDVESITMGTGTAYILRNGKVEKGTWSCPQYSSPTRFSFSNGASMTLEPGNTWVELVPRSGYPVSIQR